MLMGVGGLALMYASQTSDVIGGMLVILAVLLHFFRGRIELKSRTA
jgi:hypothetical protein